jgi:hypothetical protein
VRDCARGRVFDRKGPDWLGDVLEGLFAELSEVKRELVLDLIVHASRDADATRLSNGLDPRRDIDTVAQEVAVLDDDVAEIDADAKPHALLRGKMIVAGAQRRLNLGGAANRVYRAWKLGKNRIACGVEYPTSMHLEHLVEDFAMAAQDLDRALLVFSHHLAVADDIGHEDRCEPALERRLATAC